MKKYILLFALTGIVLNLRAQTVETGRELSRTRTLSYNSEKAALAGGVVSSLYLQPLEQWTQTTDREGNTVFSTNYKMPFQWIDRQQFLHIEGATGSYSVAINGRALGYNQSGRTAAEFDITAATTEGINTAAITIYTDPAERVLSGRAVGAGRITGDTYIVSQPHIRIRDFVASANLEGENTTLELGVIVKTHLLNTKNVRVHYALLAPDGTPGPYGHRDAAIDMRGEDTVRFFVTVPDARPWSHESPNLYTMILRLQHEGRYTEYLAYKIGLRTAEVRDGKLRVNGFEIPLAIAEYAAAGDRQTVESDLLKLKNEGINTIKIVGYAQPEYFYDLCDKIGLYVCNQADIDTRASGNSRKVGGNPSNDPQWEAAYVDRAMTMYHTSQNHPSVVMFSLADNSANGYNLYESYLALKAVEKLRPVIYTGAGGEWNTDAVNSSVAGAAVASRFVFEKGLAGRGGLTLGFADVSMVNGPRGEFSLTNNYTSLPLSPAEIVWEVRQGKSVVSQGTLKTDVAPRSTEPITISYGRAKAGRPLSATFTVYRPVEASDPAPAAPTSTLFKKKQKTATADLLKIAEKSFEIPY